MGLPERRDPRSRDPFLERWRGVYGDLQLPGGPACPAEDRLAALVLGESQEPERGKLAHHVVACRRCSSTFRDLSSLHEQALPELPVLEPADGRRHWLWLVVLLAVLAIGVTIVTVVTMRQAG